MGARAPMPQLYIGWCTPTKGLWCLYEGSDPRVVGRYGPAEDKVGLCSAGTLFCR